MKMYMRGDILEHTPKGGRGFYTVRVLSVDGNILNVRVVNQPKSGNIPDYKIDAEKEHLNFVENTASYPWQ